MKKAYKIRSFKLRKLRFARNGRQIEYDYIEDADIAVTIPVLDDGRILLERNYRRTLGKWLYELPGGHREPGESHKRNAARELEEETGYKAGRLEFLLDSYAAPGICKQHIYLYVATKLSMTKARKDPDEQISVKPMALREAVKFVRKGKNTDTKTIAGILLYAAMKNKLE